MLERGHIDGARPAPLDTPIVERAFQLARSGEFQRLRGIAGRLEMEGYLDVQEHMLGYPLLRRQLRCAARAAHA
jgi:hypothetical protein